MYRFLTHFGVKAHIYIPDRIFEGYGPNPTAINQLIDNGASLIVTVDCGSTSHEALGRPPDRNIDVVVIDHPPGDTRAAALPLPRQPKPRRRSFRVGASLCGRCRLHGLRGQRCACCARLETSAFCDRSPAWLDIWRSATVCDVVPLKGLNRAYVVKGLVAARHQSNAGLAALFRKAGLGGPITLYISAS